jgi:hypothetical protein
LLIVELLVIAECDWWIGDWGPNQQSAINHPSAISNHQPIGNPQFQSAVPNPSIRSPQSVDPHSALRNPQSAIGLI